MKKREGDSYGICIFCFRHSSHRCFVLYNSGSHDNSLDVLADQLKAAQAGFTLSSSHVGSMGDLFMGGIRSHARP